MGKSAMNEVGHAEMEVDSVDFLRSIGLHNWGWRAGCRRFGRELFQIWRMRLPQGRFLKKVRPKPAGMDYIV